MSIFDPALILYILSLNIFIYLNAIILREAELSPAQREELLRQLSQWPTKQVVSSFLRLIVVSFFTFYCLFLFLRLIVLSSYFIVVPDSNVAKVESVAY